MTRSPRARCLHCNGVVFIEAGHCCDCGKDHTREAPRHTLTPAELLDWVDGLPAIDSPANQRQRETQGASHCFAGFDQ